MKKRPLVPRYVESTIPPYVLAFLVDLARQRNWNPAPWFAGLGISPQQCFEPEARVSFRQASKVIRRALAATGEPSLGLLVGMRESLGSCGLLGFAMMSAPTFGDALSLVSRYHQVTGSLMDLRMDIGPSHASLIASERFPESDLLPFLCEEVFSGSIQIARALLGRSHGPIRTEFSYERPAYADLYDEVFRCPLHFDSNVNRIVFDSASLKIKLSTSDPTSHEAALRLCAAQNSGLRQSADEVTALQLWLREHLGAQVYIADAAQALNISERTLRRRLAGEGWSFQALHNHLRAERAEHLLRHSVAPVSAVAAEIGFSGTREFRRAFKRWTGAAPSALRTKGA